MSAFHILLLIFFLVPLVEIYLLIQIGGIVGALPTVLLVVGTAVLGVWLLRLQGLSTFMRVRQSMEQGELPAVPMLEGLMLLIAGALLLTPGFFTDAVGFVLLVPPLRQAMAREIIRRGFLKAVGGGMHRHPSQQSDHPGPKTIEGEYHRKDD